MALPFSFRVYAAWGADITADPSTYTWTNITSDVRDTSSYPGVSITTGARDESLQFEATEVTFTLHNGATTSGPALTPGRYTPRFANSPNWPYVRSNTPFKVTAIYGGTEYTRAIVYATKYEPSWDENIHAPVVTVTAHGALRRITVNQAPLRSPMYRTISRSSPGQHWPLEDGANATVLSSSLSGGQPLQIGGESLVPSSGQAPTGSAGSIRVDGIGSGTYRQSLTSPVGTGAVGTSWSVTVSFMGTANAGWVTPIFTVHTTSTVIPRWQFWGGDPGIGSNPGFVAHNPDGSPNTGWNFTGLGSAALTPGILDGNWHTVTATVTQTDSTHVTVAVQYDRGSPSGSTVVLGLAAGAINGVEIGSDSISPMTNVTALYLSQVAIWPSSTVPDVAFAAQGFAGEAAETRIARLLAEHSIPHSTTGIGGVALGPQGATTLQSEVGDAAKPDFGLLSDTFGKIDFRVHSDLNNQAAQVTMDRPSGQWYRPFAPAFDDQLRGNSWTVTRPSGSSATWTDSTSSEGTTAVGTYGKSDTVNVNTDSQLLDQASARVAFGTVALMRYPAVALNLLGSRSLIVSWVGMLAGDRLTLTGPPTEHPQANIELLVIGWAESLRRAAWNAGMVCIPYLPWSVAVVEGTGDPSPAWRVEADGATLHANIGTGDTSFQVDCANVLFTTNATFAADFPVDIDIDGEQMTVATITGTSSPQTFSNVTRSVNGVVKTHTTGAAVTGWRLPTIAL